MVATQQDMVLEATRRALITAKSEVLSDLNKVHKELSLKHSMLDEGLGYTRAAFDRLSGELDRLHDRIIGIGSEQSGKCEALRTETAQALAKLMAEVNSIDARGAEIRAEIDAKFKSLKDAQAESAEESGGRLEAVRLEIETDIKMLTDTVDGVDQEMLSLGQTISSMEHRLRCELETKFQDHAGKMLREEVAQKIDEHEQKTRPEILEQVSDMVGSSRKMLNEAISALQLDVLDDRLRTVAECQDELSARADRQGDDIDAHAKLLTAQGEKITDLDDRTKYVLADLVRTVREFSSHVPAWAQGGPPYRAQASVQHRGGVWLAKRQTHEEPGQGEDWLLIMNGVNRCTIVPDEDDPTGCAYDFVVEDTAGNRVVSSACLPTPKFLKTWGSGTYQYMDSVIKDGHRWLCVVAETSDEPGKSNDWRMMAMRGAQGRKGEKGDRGPQGEKGDKGESPSMDKVLEHWLGFLQADGGIPVTRYMGSWAVNGKYLRGDVVDFRGQPRLCVRDVGKTSFLSPEAPGQEHWIPMGAPAPTPPPAVKRDKVLVARHALAEVTCGYSVAIPLDDKYTRMEFTLTTWGHSLEISAGAGDGAVYADIALSKWDENNRVWLEASGDDSEKIEWCDRGATSLQGHLVRVPGTNDWQGVVNGVHNANDDNARPSPKARRVSLNGMIGAYGENCRFGFCSAPGEQGRYQFEIWGIPA